VLATLHVVFSSEDQQDYDVLKHELKQIYPQISVSPFRPYHLKDHSEFYATMHIEKEKVPALLKQLNNDWDGEEDDCECYGFNTRMFHPLVYCLQFQYYDEK
jgi:hypothetical protein